jgi:Flp pilus assembly protein TadD
VVCHGGRFETSHHPSQPDCTTCHMPSSLSTDVAHTEVTDHRIVRRPMISPQLLGDANANPSSDAKLPELVRFPEASKGDDDLREFALAWESIADRGISAAALEAERRLRAAIEKSPNDPALLAALGYSAQKRGDPDRAREWYEKALDADPTLIDAATNLGVIEARRGNVREAVKLWQGAFERAPGQSSIGMNIAQVLCESGKAERARDYVLRVLEFNPDLPEAKSLLQQLNSDPPRCKE